MRGLQRRAIACGQPNLRVEQVKCSANGLQVGELSFGINEIMNNHQVTWADLSPGRYRLQAVAIDEAGKHVPSPIREVSVGSKRPS